MPTEFAFVCWCARSAPTSDVVDQIYRRAHETLDWKRVQWLAERNGIAPLVHRTLSAVCPTAVPTLIRSELQRTYDAVASDGLVYTRELVRLVGVLSDAGVTAVPYKGPELAVSAYGSFFYRRFADLDVVVDASDFPTARNVLIGLACKPRRDLAEGQDASMHSAINYCETFDCPSSIGTIPLEVHWRIPATFGFDVRSCWPRLRTERLLDRDILQLSPEDVVVLLTVHGFKHFGRG